MAESKPPNRTKPAKGWHHRYAQVTLPALVGGFSLLLALAFGANAAAAATSLAATATSVTQTVTCPSGMAQLDTWGAIQGASQGGTASVSFTVAAGCNVQLSLVSYKAPAAAFSADTASQQTVFDTATATLAAGAHTLSVDVPNCFFQVDFVIGQPITNLGPAGSNNLYSAQGRLISAINGGTSSCSAATPVTDATGTGSTGNQTPVTVTVTPTVTTTTTTVIPAGPITWAPGFGPNGVVASVQTAPTTTATNTGAVLGTQTAPVMVASLPSTSTDSGDNNGAFLLGIASIALGLVLLRAGRPVPIASRLD